MKKVYLKILGVIAVLAINILTLHVAYANLQTGEGPHVVRVYQWMHDGETCEVIKNRLHAVCSDLNNGNACSKTDCGTVIIVGEVAKDDRHD